MTLQIKKSNPEHIDMIMGSRTVKILDLRKEEEEEDYYRDGVEEVDTGRVEE